MSAPAPSRRIPPAARAIGALLVLGLLGLGGVRLAALLRAGGPGEVALAPGKPGPPVDLALLDGGRFSTGASRGQVTAMAFWATWCEPCRTELPALDQLQTRLQGARIVAVNIESAAERDKVQRTVRQLGLRLPVALDGGEAAGAYHADVIPHLVILDAEGRVRDQLDGVHDADEIADKLRAAGATVR